MMTTGREGHSFYLHIPYCTKRCPYCHFATCPDDDSSKEALTKAFLEEYRLRKEEFAPFPSPLVSIYFGGGTPSLLGAERIKECLATLNPDKQACEITLELNPENSDEKKLQGFLDAGINRLSIGVQSFQDRHLKRLGRGHSADQAIQTIKQAHALGFNNISIDLMYELPTQSLEEWEESLHIAASLPITHLSLYNLTIEPGTQFYKRRSRLEKLLPQEEEGRKMLDLVSEVLPQYGLIPYEISASAREGFASKHNLGYWYGRPFLGLGPSAFSYWNGARFQNTPNLIDYLEKIKIGKSTQSFYEKLDPTASLAEHIAIALRPHLGLDLATLGQSLDTLPLSLQEALKELITLGWVQKNQDRLQLTEEGRRYYDSVGEKLVIA